MVELVKLNTARNALRYIIRAYNIKELYVPYYICPSVKSTLRKEICSIKYYHIDEHLMPIDNFRSDAYIVYPNYFGICMKNVKKLAKIYKNLIVDNSHAYYAPHIGLASFNSLRKFFQFQYGVLNGSYLYTEKLLNRPIRTADDYEIDENQDYEKLIKNENKLDEEPLMYMSKTTERIMSRIFFEQEKMTRMNKFKQYSNMFDETNELKFSLETDEIPFVYPYYTHDESIGYNLEKQGLMIFRYWQGLPVTFDEYKFYKYLIPIPLV